MLRSLVVRREDADVNRSPLLITLVAAMLVSSAAVAERDGAQSAAAQATPRGDVLHLARACVVADAAPEAVRLRTLHVNAPMRGALEGRRAFVASIGRSTRIRLTGEALRRGDLASSAALSVGDLVTITVRASRGTAASDLPSAASITDTGTAGRCSPLVLMSPRPGSVLRHRVPVRFRGSPAGAVRAVLLVDGRRRWSAGADQIAGGGGAGRWDTRTVANGRHQVTLRVVRGDRPALTRTASVRVANPPVSILAPAPGIVRGAVAWRVAVPPRTTRVAFAVDGTVKKAVTHKPWRFGRRWNSRSVADGRHRLTVTARRGRRVVGRASITVTVVNGGRSAPGVPSGGTPGAGSAPAGSGFFSPTSVWNATVPASAPLDPNSAALIADLRRQVDRGPWINTDEYSTPIYTVPAGLRKLKIKLTNSYQDPKVLAALAAVPIPPDAKPAAGTDRHMVLWQP